MGKLTLKKQKAIVNKVLEIATKNEVLKRVDIDEGWIDPYTGQGLTKIYILTENSKGNNVNRTYDI
jgi:hypothetical protein